MKTLLATLLLFATPITAWAGSTDRKVDGAELILKQIATPATPSSGKTKCYVKSDNRFYCKDSAGVEALVGGGSTGGGGSGASLNFIVSADRDAETALGSVATYNDGTVTATAGTTIQNVVYNASAGGTWANGISITIPVVSSTQTLSASFSSATGTPTLTVQLAHNGTNVTTTAQDIVNYIAADSTLNRIFTPSCVTCSFVQLNTGPSATLSGGTGAGVAAPVDATGGTAPAIFQLSRITSSPLDGTGSFQLSKLSVSCQGSGVTVPVTIPLGYRAKNNQIRFPYSVTSGYLASGQLQAFIYDTAGTLIAPAYNDVVGGAGSLSAVFPPNTASGSYRLALHCVGTSVNPYNLVFDDLEVSPYPVPLGAAMSDWQSYPLTLGATTTAPTKGTVTVDTAMWRRVGKNMELTWQYKQTGAGAAGSGSYLIPLPAGYAIDPAYQTISSAIGTDIELIVGHGDVQNGGTFGVAMIEAYSTTQLFVGVVYDGVGAGGATWSSTSFALSNASVQFSMKASVPIVGWSSNVQMANSSQFKISSYLVSGSRVTGSAPTALGQYRSYLRNASAVTYAETNGTPLVTPSVTDGIKLYSSNPWGTADTNGEPTKYEIFVGKNKSVSWEFYASTGRTGAVSIAPLADGGFTALVGALTNYDPTTGIATINTNIGSAMSSQWAGRAPDGSANISDIYFDIKVSENALSVGQDTYTVSSKTTNIDHEFASFHGATLGTNCTGSPCVMESNSDGITSVTRTSTGNYDINFVAGLFSKVPTCNCTSITHGVGPSICDTAVFKATSTTTLLHIRTQNLGAANVDSGVEITCSGPTR
jgi:hypothetical protein